jgi:CrcB protein
VSADRGNPRSEHDDSVHHRFEHHDARLPVDPDLAPDDSAEPSASHRPTRHVHRSREPDVLAAIAVGGFIGSLGRYELTLAWATPPGGVPWATFAINTSGAFLLGMILTAMLERIGPTRFLRPFSCVGVLGGWTTMSTFAVDSDLLVKDGHVTAAVVYMAATVLVGVSVAWIGIVAGRTFAVGRVQWPSP